MIYSAEALLESPALYLMTLWFSFVLHRGSVLVWYCTLTWFGLWHRARQWNHRFPNWCTSVSCFQPQCLLFLGLVMTQLMFHRRKAAPAFVSRGWRRLVSDLVFPSPLPWVLHLGWSCFVSEVGVARVRSYVTTPINLVILNSTLAYWFVFLTVSVKPGIKQFTILEQTVWLCIWTCVCKMRSHRVMTEDFVTNMCQVAPNDYSPAPYFYLTMP